MKLPKGMSVVTVDSKTVAQLYSTNIVEKDGLWLKFNSGGWRTRHTLKCTNLFLKQLGTDLSVYQKKGEWFIKSGLVVYRYRDGFQISA